jgi:peptidoglycan/xylan/chitin deacetylase (PgdA/CDA1 family)
MSTIKINELATSSIALSDFLVKADANGAAYKSTIQSLSNFLGTVGTLGFKGVLLSSDAAVTEDGIYVAGNAGTYTNNGGLVITLGNKVVLISITGTQTTFEKVEFPLSITIDASPTNGSVNAVQSKGVFDALALKVNTSTQATTDNIVGSSKYFDGAKTVTKLKAEVSTANVDDADQTKFAQVSVVKAISSGFLKTTNFLKYGVDVKQPLSLFNLTTNTFLKKLFFNGFSNNYVNPLNITDGYFMATNGTISVNASYNLSGLISVEGGVDYRRSLTDAGSEITIWFDKLGVFIDYSTGETFTSPAGAVFCILDIKNINKEITIFSEAVNYPTDNVKYEKLPNDILSDYSYISYPTYLKIPEGYTKVGEVDNSCILIQKNNPAFIIEIDTTKPGFATDGRFVLPITAALGCVVDWGDGVIETLTTQTIHTYAEHGFYSIKITGNLQRIGFNNANDKLKIIEIVNWGAIQWTSFIDAFFGCENLVITAKDVPDLSSVTIFQRAFSNCKLLVGADSMRNWDMTTVTNVDRMFDGAVLFNTDISNWIFSNSLTTIYKMLSGTVMASTITDTTIFDKFVINLANWAYLTGTPTGVDFTLISARYSQKTYSLGGQFDNALDSLDYLFNTLNWTGEDTSRYLLLNATNGFKKGYLVWGFDDGYSSWVNLLLPALQARNKKTTFFVSNSYMTGAGTFGTWAQMQTLNADGQNMEYHTLTHPDIKTQNEKEVVSELFFMDNLFYENGIQKNAHIAYPYGSYDENTIKYLKEDTNIKTGRSIRSYQGGTDINDCFFGANVSKYELPSYELTGRVADLSTYTDALDKALLEKKALCLFGHVIVPNGENIVNANYVEIGLVEGILDYCDSIGLEVLTHEEIYYLMDKN